MKKTNKKNQLSFRSRSKNNKRQISGLINDAKVYFENKQYEQANYLFQQVISLDSENISALNGLGCIAMDTGMVSLAVEFFHYAYEIDPKNITVNENLARAYTKMACYEEAIIQYLCILDFDENNSRAHGELARLNYQAGNTDLALQHYQYAFDMNPEDPRNFNGMVELDTSVITDEHISIVESLLLKSNLPLNVRCSFYFSLGKVYDITGRYDEAFANYSVANISKGAIFDADKYAAYITDIIHTFTPDLFAKYKAGELNNSSQPVFIVGMPDSGEELVEEMLTRHSGISSSGAINIIAGIAHKLNMTMDKDMNNDMSLDEISVETLNNYSRFYINDINELSKKSGKRNAARILNSLSENFLHLGLIALLFPNAHIIHCRRNPMDACLSSYFDDFTGGNGYACDLNNIAFYYRQYDRLMNYWEKTIPIDIHTVDYEAMLTEPVVAAKQIVDYLGLDGQQCQIRSDAINANTGQLKSELSFPEKAPLSVERWRHYEKYLGIMVKKLSEINGSAAPSVSAGC